MIRMGSFRQIAPRFDHLLGTGSLRGPAKLQNEANVAGEVADPHPSSPRRPRRARAGRGTWRCVHLPHLINTPKCRRSSVASRVLPCLSVFPIAARCAGPRRAAQVRAARALLGWTAKDLAQKANVGISTVQRVENAEGTPNVHASNLASIQSTLESAGIEFTNGDAPGIRMRRKPAR